MFITVIQILGTVIMVASLICLVIQTRKLSKQTESLEKSIIGNSIVQISNNYREIWTHAFNFPELAKLINVSDETDISPSEVRETLFLNMLLNQVDSIFNLCELDILPESEYDGLKKEVERAFSSPKMCVQWEAMKGLFSNSFQKFIDAIIEKLNK